MMCLRHWWDYCCSVRRLVFEGLNWFHMISLHKGLYPFSFSWSWVSVTQHWHLCQPQYFQIRWRLLWSSVAKLAKKFTQLVSTSNKRSSSGEMKIDLKRVGIYRGDGLDTWKDQRWTVKFNIHTSCGGWLISDQCHGRCEVTFAIKSEVWWHILTPYHGMFGDEGMPLLNTCLVLKSWPVDRVCNFDNFVKELNSIE